MGPLIGEPGAKVCWVSFRSPTVKQFFYRPTVGKHPKVREVPVVEMQKSTNSERIAARSSEAAPARAASGGTIRLTSADGDPPPTPSPDGRPSSLLIGALEATADGLYVLDRDYQVVHCNERFLEILPEARPFVEDGSLEEAREGVRSLFDDPEAVITVIERERENPMVATAGEFRLADGRHVHRTSRPIRVDGELAGRVTSVRDVTELREHERRLEHAHQLAEVGSWTWEIDSNQVRWSDELYQMLGLEREQFEATYEGFLNQVHPEDRYQAHDTVQDALERRDGYRTKFRMVRPDGTVCHVAALGEVETRPDGEPVRIRGVVRDRTREQLLLAQLQEQALRDGLTSLPNRRLLQERGEQSLAEARRTGCAVGFLFLDLTGFKRINERLGHPFGDEILKQVADRLTEYVRDADVTCRVGGDEFVVLAPQLDAPESVNTVARRVQEAMEEPFEHDGESIALDIAIGVAVFPHHADTLDELMQCADTALFGPDREKSPGIRMFDPDFKQETPDLIQLGEELQEALQEDQFTLHYQPVIPTGGGAPVGVEALCRWDHPDRGLLSAGEFIELAESTGLVTSLDRWAATAGLRDNARWSREEGWGGWMAVNLSMRSLSSPDLPERIDRLLEDTEPLDPSRFMIEVTEHAAMRNPEVAERILRLLEGDLGVSIAIDDFGTGYSSLRYLKKFPAHHLKVDMDFVQGIGENPDDEKVIRGVVSLGHEFGMEIVAEGVETEEQAAWLREAGCDHMQGYLIGRPVAAEELDLVSSVEF